MARSTRLDVAQRAGVAPSTVSNILNGRATALRIADATVARVEQAAKDLGYIPHAGARATAGARSKAVGLVLGALPPSPYVAVVHDVLVTAITTAEAAGYVVVPIAQPEKGTSARYVDRLLSDVDLAGVVVEHTPRNAEAGRRLAKFDIPVVWMSLETPGERLPGVAHVYADEKPGVRAVLERLTLAPDKHLAIMVGPTYRPERLDVAEALFPGRTFLVEASSWLPDAGAETARALLLDDPRVGALFCADDLLALGALRACRELGISVPEDLSIVGFGGYDIAEHFASGLTTAHWPLRALTSSAFEALFEHLESEEPSARLDVAPLTPALESTPIVRSTATLRSAGQ